jgi:hypothetical protein
MAIPIEIIVGAQLSSVEFVQDYVQLRFDGPTLTLFVWPSLHGPSRTMRFGEVGYRDELCGRISHTVLEAKMRPDTDIIIKFDDAVELFVSLKPECRTCPEAGYFSTTLTGGALLDF